MSRRSLQHMKPKGPRSGPPGEKKSYHIFRQLPNNKIIWVRIGSVRLGRTLRAVKQLAKYSRDHYFAAYAMLDFDNDGRYIVDPHSKRYYENHKQKLPEQRERRARRVEELRNSEGESLNDVLVDIYRRRRAREVPDAVDQH